MKNKIFISLFLFLLFSFPESCTKDPICACGIEHPEENIKWLKDILTQAYSLDVYKLSYNETEYIIIADPPGPDAIRIVYDCEGIFLCKYGGYIAGSNTCYLTSLFWDSYNVDKILIYQQRIHP